MSLHWIVHREPQQRAAIARLIQASDDAVRGAPGDPLFDTAPAAEVILLGLVGDFEAELQFAHHISARVPGAGWILLADSADLDRARRLFDTLEADLLSFPPDPLTLRARCEALARGSAEPLPLSHRFARAALSEQFARWLGDLELPELLRALDPRHSQVPLLIRGEPGSGRSLLARYVHTFGGSAGGDLAQLVCAPETSAETLRRGIAATSRTERARRGTTLWLDDIDRLEPTVQRTVEGWLRIAPPEGTLAGAATRWIGTASRTGSLVPGLAEALGAISVALPPLRERRHLVAHFANETARAWCSARGQRPQRFGEHALAVLEEYPWPGNLRELEAVVVQTLVTDPPHPIGAEDLLYGGAAFAPLDAGDVGTVLLDETVEDAGDVGAVLLDETVEDEIDPEPAEIIDEIPEGDDSGATVEPPETPTTDAAILRQLAGAVAHEVRNPLATIRSFAQLLPERFSDTEFRNRFATLVGQDVLRIEDVVERLGRLASLAPPERKSVDIVELLEHVLAQRRDKIHARRLVVLKELDFERPQVLGDTDQLRFALEAVLNQSLELVPERGNLYIASRYHSVSPETGASVRVLLRFHGGARTAPVTQVQGVSPAENALEYTIAELIVRIQGGAFAVHREEGDEIVVVLDLPAPS